MRVAKKEQSIKADMPGKRCLLFVIRRFAAWRAQRIEPGPQGRARPVADLRSASMPKRFDHEGERRRRLSAARIVKVITRKSWAPVFEHANEASVLDVWRHLVFENIGKAKTCDGSLPRKDNVIEDNLPFDAHFHLAPVLLELPRP